MSEHRFSKQHEILLDGDDVPSFVYICASDSINIGASSTSDRKIYIFDLKEAKTINSFHAHTADITGIAMNEQSYILASCCSDGDNGQGNEFSLWDLRGYKKITTFYPDTYFQDIELCESLAISKDGCIFAVGTNEGVLTWDVRKPEAIFKHVNIQPDTIASLQFHPFAHSTILSGDDSGNILLYDLDASNTEDSILFYSNDDNPVFQCGFCGVDKVFTLRRTAGMRIWNIMDPTQDVVFDDTRNYLEKPFVYPIDVHWCGEWIMLTGGDSEGGVTISLCSEVGVQLFAQIPNAHKDCINASHVNLSNDGKISLYLAGDKGQLSYWEVQQ